MKHKTWFRLVLQAIGVLLIGLALPSFIQDVAGYVVWRSAFQSVGRPMATGGPEEMLRVALQMLPSLVQAAFGIYLLTGATWLLNKIIPSNRPYCPECGYDLTHNTGAKCAECGVALPGDVRCAEKAA